MIKDEIILSSDKWWKACHDIPLSSPKALFKTYYFCFFFRRKGRQFAAGSCLTGQNSSILSQLPALMTHIHRLDVFLPRPASSLFFSLFFLSGFPFSFCLSEHLNDTTRLFRKETICLTLAFCAWGFQIEELVKYIYYKVHLIIEAHNKIKMIP